MMLRCVVRCWPLLLLMFCSSSANALQLEEKVQEHTLKNGLRLLMVERHDAPTVAAYITLGVGSVDEGNENRGVAHLLEHMLFKGTKQLGTVDYRREAPLLAEIEVTAEALSAAKVQTPRNEEEVSRLAAKLSELQEQHRPLVVKDEFSRIYAENGGSGYNAFTSKDLTTYLIELPANKLELWAAIESDRMQNAVLREFYTERNVVMEERRRSRETEPRGLLYEHLLATAFTVHPYRAPIIGWMSDLEHLTLAETRNFLHRYYAPVNTVIALVGDFNPEDAITLVERYFGAIPTGEPVPKVTAVEPPQRGERRVNVVYDCEPQMLIAYRKAPLPDRDDYLFDLAAQILGEGRSSRLYRRLVEEEQLATSVATYGAPGSRYPNLFVISAIPRSPHNAAEVETVIYEELARLGNELVSDEELEQARKQLRVGTLRQLRGNGGLARMLTYYQTVAGDWRYVTRYNEAITSLSAEELQGLARRAFVPENRTVATIGRSGE